jgi:N-6 DNA methylase
MQRSILSSTPSLSKPRVAATEIRDNVAGFKETRRMIENIFQLKWVVARHKNAPLLKEREQFLAHCHQQGTSHKALHNMAPELISVIRLLRMEELREVSLDEIKQAAEEWAEEQRSNPKARSYAKSAAYFVYVAKKWLRFHGKLRMPCPPRARFADELDDFAEFMATEQGLSPISIRSHRWKTSKSILIKWSRRVSMEEITENDFNLNISRYISTAVAEEEIDLGAVHIPLSCLTGEGKELVP